MARKKLRWTPEQLMGKYPSALLKRDSAYMAVDDLKKMLFDAYNLGYVHASEDAKNPTPRYSTQRQYAERYARIRDLAAHSVDELPLEFNQRDGTVAILQGDLLDDFLDRKGGA